MVACLSPRRCCSEDISLKAILGTGNKCFLGSVKKAELYKAQKVGNSKVSVSDPFSHHVAVFQSSSPVRLLFSRWEPEGWLKGERDDSLLKSSCSLPSFGTFSAGASHCSHNRLWKRGFRPVNSYRRQLHSFVLHAKFIVCCSEPCSTGTR